ncbi:MAG TPA: Gfo/Idh/MocA family oxidoreductase [Candidatus Micrarchaeia archaeon]|nr:Gfo/Idh/MocA family oxidoreductase [Candidatus Micrarchaeia archaeon]
MRPPASPGPVGVAILGVGHWGPNLLRNFREDHRTRILWVIDRDSDRLAHVAERYPGVRLSDSPASAFDDPAVAAAVIATPASTHFDLARLALAAGKHCLVEKPLATSAAAAQELVRTAAEARLTLAVGHVFLYNPAIRQAKAYIDEGTIGKPYYASMVRTNLGPPHIDVNVSWDLATHDVSIANYWFGAPPNTASARGGSWIDRGREDTLFATLTYPDDRLVHIMVSWLSPRKMRDITLVGSRMMVTIDDMNLAEPMRLHDKGIDSDTSKPFIDSFGAFRASIRDGEIRVPRIVMGEPLRAECQDFIDSIVQGRDPLASGAAALPVVRTIEAINRSMQNRGREESV